MKSLSDIQAEIFKRQEQEAAFKLEYAKALVEAFVNSIDWDKAVIVKDTSFSNDKYENVAVEVFCVEDSPFYSSKHLTQSLNLWLKKPEASDADS